MSRLRAAAPLLWRFALGALVGVFAHYVLYRLALPGAPFIYAAF